MNTRRNNPRNFVEEEEEEDDEEDLLSGTEEAGDSFIEEEEEWETDWESDSQEQRRQQQSSESDENSSSSEGNEPSEGSSVIIVENHDLPLVGEQNNTEHNQNIMPDSGSQSDEDQPRKPKRRRVLDLDDTQPGPSSPQQVDDENVDDGCTICYEEYTSSGDHRLVSLKCGHFFGKNCIERWIRSEGRAAACPNCKQKAQNKDVRVHFTKSIQMIDTSALEELKGKNAELERKNNCLEMELAKTRRELQELQNKLKQEISPSIHLPSVIRAGRIILSRFLKLDLAPSGQRPGARAFDYNGDYFAIGVHQHQSGLWGPYSIKRASIDWAKQQLMPGPALPLHSNRSRVVAISPYQSNLILSGGEDRKVVVHTVGENTRKTWQMPDDAPVWSGCWLSATNFIVGLSNGRVYEFNYDADDRQPIRDVTKGVGRFPIIFVSCDPKSSVILVSSANKMVAYLNNAEFPLIVPSERGLTSIRSIAWDPRTLTFVATFVGNVTKPINHILYKMEIDGTVAHCTPVSTWETTSVKNTTMWNNCVFSMDSYSIFSVIFNEDKRQIEAHDWSGKRENVFIPFPGKDINPCAMKDFTSPTGARVIAVLTENVLYTFTLGISE